MDICSHFNDIIDTHEGTIICIDCGFVKGQYFDEKNHKKHDVIINNSLGDVENIIDQLNLSQQFSETIHRNLLLNGSQFKKKNNFDIEKKHSIKKLVSEIYNTVNDKNSYLLLKDIVNFSKLSPNQIKTRNISIINLEEILEKYTKKFNLDFKTYTVIKEKISKYVNTGYQPLTIIGSIIYLYFIDIGKKISMKNIALILGISSVSIQRFIKSNIHNEIPSRSRTTKR